MFPFVFERAMTIQIGDHVRIHYTTRALDGSVMETSRNREPFEFVAGEASVIPAVSRGVIGLGTGDAARLTADPDSAFGRPLPDLVQAVPRSLIPSGFSSGDQLATRIGNTAMDVWIQRSSGRDAIVDANHPLAGETLVIDVEVVGWQPRLASRT